MVLACERASLMQCIPRRVYIGRVRQRQQAITPPALGQKYVKRASFLAHAKKMPYHDFLFQTWEVIIVRPVNSVMFYMLQHARRYWIAATWRNYH